MTKDVKREIRYRLKNIMEVSLFLVVTTWFWYGPRVEWQEQKAMLQKSYAYMSGVNLKENNRVTIKEGHRQGEYQFTISNHTSSEKEILVSLVIDYDQVGKHRCLSLANPNIQYFLMREEEQDFTPRTLSIDGNILITTLQPQEERTYRLQYFVAEDLDLKNMHFHGHAILSNGQNL